MKNSGRQPSALTDIFDVEELNSLVKDFSKNFGFCAFILDADGNVLVKKPFVADNCARLLAQKDTAKKCFQDTISRFKDQQAVKKCWSGYEKIVVPMKIKSKTVGYWVTCGIQEGIKQDFIKGLAKLLNNFINNFSMRTYEKWWKEREMILDVSNNLISERNYDLLLEKIVSSATKILDTKRTTLYLYENDCLVSKIAEGTKKNISLKIGDGAAGKCALTRKVIALDDVSKADIKDLVADFTVRNLICAPIIFERKLYGVIESFNKETIFSDKDVKILSYLADSAAIALNNAYTFREMEKMTFTDPLTQLFNRNYFIRAIDKEIHRLSRYSGNLSVMFIDIDDFKKLNDTYGHTVGDIVLRELANVIRESLREVDIAARFGGEEFVIMLTNTEREGAFKTAQRLQIMINNTNLAGHRISVSIGIANYQKGISAKSLIDRADKAMYNVKKTSKNSISFWD